MALLQPVRELLSFLQKNAALRARIAAPPNATLLYAGRFFRPVWKEIEQLRVSRPEVASKTLLPDVLSRIATPGQSHPHLLGWAKALDALSPWHENGFIVWRALSGIFAANAVGAVSFYIGSGVTRDDKVFAATELPVLLRNPNVDATTKDLLAYFQRCVQRGQAEINLGFMAG